jgi:CubicO group peptidase (beta-lactamase class C family)
MLFRAGTFQLPATPEGRAVGIPAAGGVGSARGLTTLYAAAAGWGREALLSGETLGRFAQTQVIGHDVVLDSHRSHGLIFQKPTSDFPFGSHRAYGHDGAGGSMAFADPDGEIAFGYTVQRTPFPGGADPLAVELAGMIRRIVTGSRKSAILQTKLSR